MDRLETQITGKGKSMHNMGPLSLLQSLKRRGKCGRIQSDGSGFEVVWVGG